ncbi:MAG: hypothetical protein ACD_17C00215G0001, partial [uncultured bacterium]
IRAQIINLLKELQMRLGLTILFIAHDLTIIRYLSDRILMMDQGKAQLLQDLQNSTLQGALLSNRSI